MTNAINRIFNAIKNDFFQKAVAYKLYSAFNDDDDRYKFIDKITDKYGDHRTEPLLDLSWIETEKVDIQIGIKKKMKDELGDPLIRTTRVIDKFKSHLLRQAEQKAKEIYKDIRSNI